MGCIAVLSDVGNATTQSERRIRVLGAVAVVPEFDEVHFFGVLHTERRSPTVCRVTERRKAEAES